MCDWSNEFTLKFLELYQNEPIIWDPMHLYHKDRKQINDAWVRLSGQLECPVTELKKKKDSLMATFRGHLRKKTASIRSGAGVNDIYKPIWFAYEYMESFLSPSFLTDEQSQSVEISAVHVEENQSVVPENITENASTVVPEQ
ncbi:MADF domain-containing protein [Aphis craccivora]|uniref:MADF domain-containing protein n=1 Tax=Aphis craccivora TaxID=307492 RepID=A0A6G0VUT4_APHCR|nr:MADF domain-containing protein [Aphis craccivora]